jgi:nicotinate-nucleotide adenylyltransferase
MENIVLFGGAFDPVHAGHLYLAENAFKTLKASKVIFIPSKTPFWKKEGAQGALRLKMLEETLKGYPHFEVSDFELREEGDYAYSIDTLRHFSKVYPSDSYRLYFLIGQDQLNNLDRWKDIKELADLVTFIYARRPNFSLNKENEAKYHVLCLNGEEKDISSSKIRLGQDYSMDLTTIDFIEENSLYYVPKVRPYMKPRRYEHAKSVAHLAYQIAEANHLDPYKAYMAGYLHDITRKGTKECYNRKAEELYKSYFPNGLLPSWAYHQFTAPMVLKDDFQIEDEEVMDAIRYHTTGKAHMSPLGMILYASDKIEPTRGYDSSNMIAEMKKDYFQGFITVLKANKEFLEETNSGLAQNDRLTLSCFECYLKGE